ncbi:MAG: MerC family mercury resistance protein [Sulfuricaulis sp.]
MLEIKGDMPTVELIYDNDCPNVLLARENLLRAFSQAGLVPRWREWDRADTQAPEYARKYGSPTVLVNGKDVAGSGVADASCCRIYMSDDGIHRGAPPVASIMVALSQTSKTRRFGNGIMPLVPAIGTALMPKLICPACWPAYAGLLSALGLGFIDYTPLLLPLTLVFLVVVLATLAWRAKARRGYAPLLAGMVAAFIVLVGKFQFDSNIATYTGIALLVGASLWNSWPRRSSAASCPACVVNTDPIKPLT